MFAVINLPHRSRTKRVLGILGRGGERFKRRLVLIFLLHNRMREDAAAQASWADMWR